MDPYPHPEIPSPGMHIFGWMAPTELDWLYATARTMKSIVEIGTNRGRSAYALGKGVSENGGRLYCFDLWDDPGDHGFRAFAESMAEFGNAVVGQRGRSPDVLTALGPDFMVDMVFIDGDHEYDSVIADIQGWLPRTRKVICGHDYTVPTNYGVNRAVDEIFGDRATLAGDPGDTSIWVVRLDQ